MAIDRHEFIDGTRFAELGDIGFSDQHMNPKAISEHVINQHLEQHTSSDRLPIIYVSSDHVTTFLAACENVQHKFILLSHNGDTTFTQGHVEHMPECVHHWFGQNINTRDPRATPLPIGLEREFWSESRYGKHGHIHDRLNHFSQSPKLARVINCYINFTPTTNIRKRGWIAEHFKYHDWCTIHMPGINGNIDTYFEHLKRSQFVICPDGNGVDCHRNWNALYLGAVPVLERCDFHEQVYQDLPVLLVDSFKQLTLNMLHDHKHLIHDATHPKLRMSWWSNEIMNKARK